MVSGRCCHLQLLYQEFTDLSVDTRHLEKPNSDTGEDSPDHSWSRLVGMDNGFIFTTAPQHSEGFSFFSVTTVQSSSIN